jgi:hypothetical protein
MDSFLLSHTNAFPLNLSDGLYVKPVVTLWLGCDVVSMWWRNWGGRWQVERGRRGKKGWASPQQ